MSQDVLDRYITEQAEGFREGLEKMIEKTGIDPESTDVDLQTKMDKIHLETEAVEIMVDPQYMLEDIDVALKSITSTVRGLRREQKLDRGMLDKFKGIRNKLSSSKSKFKDQVKFTQEDLTQINGLLNELAVVELALMQ